jgi:L-ascorbate metabolism protein UlaG (beta-lactamase superfamily)
MMTRFTRRGLLTASVLASAGAAWTSVSDSWSARFLRGRLAEFGQDVPKAPHTPAPASWNDNAVTLAWLGHATVLINFYGLRILTDPVLFQRIGVDLGIGSFGPLRLVQCALAPAALPELDLVLVSHAHFDHLDTPSLAAVRGRPRIQRDTHRGYGGFVIEREGRRLLIGGDTANTAAFGGHRRYGPFDAAVMPIGAYDPWINNHCTPEQAVAMADAAGARLFLPVHHRSFNLSREPVLDPIARTERVLDPERGRLGWRDIGETIVISS